ncbi:hypothetical protein [Parahaliea aestuarii]|uniref:Uncharacterized protein n=1 Tax=Parahaliea aestuarii TaxID=1852021 RepID=A0A5C8ZRG7_9GAMM|nr:hypothetical protein [Parahaliea aestuarii]TXS89941.1 hypothetical protein FVW59_15110 [Parahaliea aestuarii]
MSGHVMRLSVIVGLLLVAFEAAAVKEIPRHSYKCQLVSETGSDAYLEIQAHSLEDAKRLAKSASVEDREGLEAPVKAIKECIEAGHSTYFKDSEFQRYTERLAQ